MKLNKLMLSSVMVLMASASLSAFAAKIDAHGNQVFDCANPADKNDTYNLVARYGVPFTDDQGSLVMSSANSAGVLNGQGKMQAGSSFSGAMSPRVKEGRGDKITVMYNVGIPDATAQSGSGTIQINTTWYECK